MQTQAPVVRKSMRELFEEQFGIPSDVQWDANKGYIPQSEKGALNAKRHVALFQYWVSAFTLSSQSVRKPGYGYVVPGTQFIYNMVKDGALVGYRLTANQAWDALDSMAMNPVMLGKGLGDWSDAKKAALQLQGFDVHAMPFDLPDVPDGEVFVTLLTQALSHVRKEDLVKKRVVH